MARISIKHLEAFAKVADQQSFRGAAQALNTTQPNISARIAALESLIGQRLMDRDAGSVRLTPTGERLLPKARGVIAAVDDFVASAGAPDLFQGTLRLGVTEMIAHSWIGAYLSALGTRFPSLGVELSVDVSANLSEALHDRRIDLALQSGPFEYPVTGSVALGSYGMAWVAAPALGLGSRMLDRDALARFTVLTHPRGTLPYQQVARHFAGAKPARIVPSSNSSACIRMTLEGLGVACLMRSMVAEEIAAGRLEELSYPWVPDALEFFARFHSDGAPYHLAQAAGIAREVSLASRQAAVGQR